MEANFTFDVARSIFLGRVIPHFGIPESRRTLKGKNNTVEILKFPSQSLVRFVTFGLSLAEGRCGDRIGRELLFVIPQEASEEDQRSAFAFLVDVCAHVLELEQRLEVPSMSPPSKVSPWEMKAILFDEPRGEPEDLESIPTGSGDAKLTWVVPLHESEWKLATQRGLETLDEYFEANSVDLVDIHRRSLVTP